MAASTQGSSVVAGKNHLGLLSLSLMFPVEWMAAEIAAYREAWNSADASPLTDVSNNRVAAYTLVHCADSMEDCEKNGVWEAIGWWYRAQAEFQLKWEFPNITQEERDRRFPLLTRLLEGEVPVRDFHDADMIIVGDSERCLEKLKRYADAGCDEVICYVEFGHMPHEGAMRTIELLGKEVIPELKKYRPVPFVSHAG